MRSETFGLARRRCLTSLSARNRSVGGGSEAERSVSANAFASLIDRANLSRCSVASYGVLHSVRSVLHAVPCFAWLAAAVGADAGCCTSHVRTCARGDVSFSSVSNACCASRGTAASFRRCRASASRCSRRATRPSLRRSCCRAAPLHCVRCSADGPTAHRPA